MEPTISLRQEEDGAGQPFAVELGAKVNPSISRLHLGVLTHCAHWLAGDGVYSYAPFVREMNIWMSIFDKVTVAAPLRRPPIRKDNARYDRRPTGLLTMKWSGENGTRGNIQRVCNAVGARTQLMRLAHIADVVHLRLPSLLGLPAQILWNRAKPYVVKYAEPWGGWYRGESVVARLQRSLLQKGFPGGITLVYGPSKPPYIQEFFPACMSEEECRRNAQSTAAKSFVAPWQILVVSRLIPVKSVDLAIKALVCLRRTRPNKRWRAVVIGEGRERPRLMDIARSCGIMGETTFAGSLPFQEVLIEACSCRVVPVAALAGLSDRILGYGRYGVTAEPTPAAVAEAIDDLTNNPHRLNTIAAAGPELAFRVTTEAFRTTQLNH